VARIRIVDEWLRSPVSAPSRYRAIMVIAESWAEQRVLMRAFATSPDQTRPTIVLHGCELAIGPAGTDPHGEWGIHVEPPVDGRAQELREQLRLAARRLAGSKGNPPRLEDEVPDFDRKRTNHWAPGTPRDLPSAGRATQFNPAQAAARAGVAPSVQRQGYYEPAEVAPPASSPVIPSAAPRWQGAPPSPTPVAGVPQQMSAPSPTPVAGMQAAAPAPRRRRRGWTSPVQTVRAREVGSTTAAGFASGSANPAGRRPTPKQRGLSSVVSTTCPLGFRLSDAERAVLNALGTRPLRASEVAQIAGVPDGAVWMAALMARLADHGIDLIAPGDEIAGEPSYMLRH
jgi:hypothetical protein